MRRKNEIVEGSRVLDAEGRLGVVTDVEGQYATVEFYDARAGSITEQARLDELDVV